MEERTTCSACWQDTVNLQQEWRWERDSTTTHTSLARPSAWPRPSTTRFWSMTTVSKEAVWCVHHQLSLTTLSRAKGRKCSNRNCAGSTWYVLKVLHFQSQDCHETANQNRHVNFKMLYHKKWPRHSQFTKIFLSRVTKSLIVELKSQYRWILFCNTSAVNCR